MSKPNPKVDGFLRKARQWQPEFKELRRIILGFPLAEDMKWRWPCYTLDKHNIVLMHGFKEHCDLLFFKGALLKDPKKILIAPGQTQAGRQMRFTDVEQIHKLEPIIKTYINEAIRVEKSGLKVKLKKTADFKVPEELKTKLDELPGLKTAFNALTPGRQRGYIFYFSSAKQSTTRTARVEKCIPKILKGKGLDD